MRELTDKEKEKILLEWDKKPIKTRTEKEWREYMVKKLNLMSKIDKLKKELNELK